MTFALICRVYERSEETGSITYGILRLRDDLVQRLEEYKEAAKTFQKKHPALQEIRVLDCSIEYIGSLPDEWEEWGWSIVDGEGWVEVPGHFPLAKVLESQKLPDWDSLLVRGDGLIYWKAGFRGDIASSIETPYLPVLGPLERLALVAEGGDE